MLARVGGELRGHPVEEDAVELGAGEGAHLRTHGGEDEADVAERFAERGQVLAHRGERLLREAGADSQPEALAR